MCKTYMEKQYNNYLNQKITIEDFCLYLLEEIYKTPKFFTCCKMEEDCFSEFLLWIHKSLPSVVKRYKISASSFQTYFTNTIRLQTKSFLRFWMKKKAFELVLDNHNEEEKLYDPPAAEEMIMAECHADSFLSKKENKARKNVNLQAKTLLILALKNYPFLNNNHIEMLPKMTATDKELFYNYLTILEQRQSKNMQRYKEAEGRVNHTYVKCKQYENELKNLDPDTIQHQVVQKQLETSRRLLSIRRKQMELYTRRLRPKNSVIADVLNEDRNFVARALLNAEKNLGSIKE
ncbi:MAG: hypothetical protein J6B81_01650 [Spirochaetaceae bacterium]|nr:hypothetical protein [Spirochaetaceae bacterium]